MMKKIFLLLIMQTMAGQIWAQEEKQHFTSVMLAGGFSDHLNVSYDYRHIFVHYQYHRILHPRWQWILQPNFHIFECRSAEKSNNITGLEWGMNVHLLYHIVNGGRQKWYVQGGTGPHYLSRDIPRQKGGFLFASSLLAGFTKKISDKVWLDFSAGFRHISNAEIALPNGGINTLLLRFGVQLH